MRLLLLKPIISSSASWTETGYQSLTCVSLSADSIMSSLLARTGRHKQRYEDQLRLVAGCIPYRLEQNVEGCHGSSENKLLVLMISSPNRDDLVFPKGGWEDDETIREAACREAFEEAGVKGILGETPLGDWKFQSKSRQKSCSREGGCRGYMFALKVTEELDSWPEQSNYDRKWLKTLADVIFYSLPQRKHSNSAVMIGCGMLLKTF